MWTKRAAELAAFLQEEGVEEEAHAQWVFTVPKMLRVYFLHHGELLSALSLAAYETVKELLAAAVAEEKSFRPGLVSVVQTFGDRANFHPVVHRWFPGEAGRFRGVDRCRMWMRQRPKSSSATRS